MKDYTTKIEALLQSISIEIFLKYFEDFKLQFDHSYYIELFNANEEWNEDSYEPIIVAGLQIFSDNLEESVLVYIRSKNGICNDRKEIADDYLEVLLTERKRQRSFADNLPTEDDMHWSLRDYEEEQKIIYGR
jgi:hypothetical protein